MLAGESPFNTRSILHLMQLIRYGNIKWPSFLSTTCISFLKGLLKNNPMKRMTWNEILEHKFVKGNILIMSTDKSISDSPFTRPRVPVADEVVNKRVAQFKKLDINEDVMSSRDSIKVNLNLQSDMDETDNEDIAMLKNESDDIQTSNEGAKIEPNALIHPLSFRNNFHQLHQFEAPRAHNIANIQPLADNPNMVMHQLMDNVDPELQQFLMSPPMMMMPLPPPIMGSTQISTHKTKSEVPHVKKSQKTLSTDVSSVPIETEEWLQFIFKSMQEVLDGDLEIYKQENMMTMIVGLLRDPKFNSKVIDHVVQIICLPYTIDMPKSLIDEIDKMYLQLKLVPNLVYASKLLCQRKISSQVRRKVF